MENKVHTFSIDIDWKLIDMISQIDRFDASWTTIERKEGQSRCRRLAAAGGPEQIIEATSTIALPQPWSRLQ